MCDIKTMRQPFHVLVRSFLYYVFIQTFISIFTGPERSRPDEVCEVCRGGGGAVYFFWFEILPEDGTPVPEHVAKKYLS